MTVCASDAATRIESLIAEEVGPHRFNIWFKNATSFEFTDGFLRVGVPNPFISDYLDRHFAETIRAIASQVTGTECGLAFVIDPKLAGVLRPKQPDRQVDDMVRTAERTSRSRIRGTGLCWTVVPLKGRLEDFVVGPSNRLAHAAALSVVESPGTVYNPLFLHGGCGLGKTHLLQAICNAIAERCPTARWRYVSGEEFTNDYICAVKAREEDTFRSRYRNLDLLAIDDVHFFANKKGTQAEFLHTLHAIDVAAKQVILASDAHPKMIGHFSDSLITRFLAGMVVRIDAPDLAVRAEVLRRRSQRLNARIPEPVIGHIAETFQANIRELDGALLKVVAAANLAGQPVTLSLADRALRDLVRQTAPVIKLSDIESVVAIYFGLTPADLHTSRKSRTIAQARGIAMYLARKHTSMSFPEIGRFMGNKDHTTVLLAVRRISKAIQADQAVRWLTPAGEKERNLAELVLELEQQMSPSSELSLPDRRALAS